jgi:hypothetical protein
MILYIRKISAVIKRSIFKSLNKEKPISVKRDLETKVLNFEGINGIFKKK